MSKPFPSNFPRRFSKRQTTNRDFNFVRDWDGDAASSKSDNHDTFRAQVTPRAQYIISTSRPSPGVAIPDLSDLVSSSPIPVVIQSPLPRVSPSEEDGMINEDQEYRDISVQHSHRRREVSVNRGHLDDPVLSDRLRPPSDSDADRMVRDGGDSDPMSPGTGDGGRRTTDRVYMDTGDGDDSVTPMESVDRMTHPRRVDDDSMSHVDRGSIDRTPGDDDSMSHVDSGSIDRTPGDDDSMSHVNRGDFDRTPADDDSMSHVDRGNIDRTPGDDDSMSHVNRGDFDRTPADVDNMSHVDSDIDVGTTPHVEMRDVDRRPVDTRVVQRSPVADVTLVSPAGEHVDATPKVSSDISPDASFNVSSDVSPNVSPRVSLDGPRDSPSTPSVVVQTPIQDTPHLHRKRSIGPGIPTPPVQKQQSKQRKRKEKRNEPVHNVGVWQGEVGRSKAHIMDLDIALNDLDNQLTELRDSDRSQENKAESKLLIHVRKNITQTIESVDELRHKRTEINKTKKNIRDSRRDLTELQQENSRLTEKLEKNKKNSGSQKKLLNDWIKNVDKLMMASCSIISQPSEQKDMISFGYIPELK